MIDSSGMKQRLGTRLSGHCDKCKGRGPHVLSKTVGVSQTSLLLILSSAPQAYAVTLCRPLPRVPHLYCTPKPLLFLSPHSTDSQLRGKTEAVLREGICSIKYLTCGNISFEVLQAWLISMKTSRTENCESNSWKHHQKQRLRKHVGFLGE